jgi:hypothetical protein
MTRTAIPSESVLRGESTVTDSEGPGDSESEVQFYVGGTPALGPSPKISSPVTVTFRLSPFKFRLPVSQPLAKGRDPLSPTLRDSASGPFAGPPCRTLPSLSKKRPLEPLLINRPHRYRSTRGRPRARRRCPGRSGASGWNHTMMAPARLAVVMKFVHWQDQGSL